MTEGVKTIIYPVKDLARAKRLYGKLVGVEPYVDQAYTSASTSGARRLVWIPTSSA